MDGTASAEVGCSDRDDRVQGPHFHWKKTGDADASPVWSL